MSVAAAALSLTRVGWRDDDAAWKALVLCQPLLHRAVTRALRTYPEYRQHHEELQQAVLYDRAKRLLRQQGLPCGPQAPHDPAAWLSLVFRNAALDHLRAWRRRDHRLTHQDPVHVPAPDTTVPPDDLNRAWQALDALPPRYALAWVLRYAPECLNRTLVQRACAAENRGHRQAAKGLARTPEETWRALERWRDQYAQRPGSHAARRELAWVLRSDDANPPEHWRAQHPAEARRAQDTVGTWQRRAREHLSCHAR